ncbi:hypothetical protein H7J86_32760 [Mycobacterium hackensackense]|uniref:hypothetical protein n=1 Tax=Mycobacterium hackensackense TaxID=228909 RepID=UPI002265DFA3|nr:hypothetical protein [Mycobacterium hackensackense]MCV7256957.1 hypothetical protein [Mycobacterium hackensackense]
MTNDFRDAVAAATAGTPYAVTDRQITLNWRGVVRPVEICYEGLSPRCSGHRSRPSFVEVHPRATSS